MTQRHSIAGLLALLTGTGALATPRFIENDFESARIEARTRKRPLLAEIWAPW
jgi:hypothetical protein